MVLILFKHQVHSDQYYLWNGFYPVNITGGWPSIDSPPWNINAEVSPEEYTLFRSLETSKKQVFTIKTRGTFQVLKRIPIPIPT